MTFLKKSTCKIFFCLILVFNLMSPMKALALDKSNMNISTWLWNTQDIVKGSDKILSFLSANGTKELYLQINYNISISEYKKFIKAASLKKISVHALSGSPYWVFPQGQTTQKKFFDWITKYQSGAQADEKFKGIHLDVEPYLNSLYAASPNEVIQGFQDLMISSVNKSNALGLPMAIDIPFWYDTVSYSNIYGNGVLADWIFKNIKSVNIMAYRNSALGDNGIISLVSNEMNLANTYNDKVTIASETLQSSEGDYLSFYSLGQSKMEEQLDIVYNYYSSYTSFNGFAIHDVRNWMLLKP